MALQLSTDTPRSAPFALPRANALTRKLERHSTLDTGARVALYELEHSSEWIGAGVSVAAEGETSDALLSVLEGLAYCHKDFRDGRRQIITFLVPGDTCGNCGTQPKQIDHGVRTLTRVRIARIATDRFLTLLKNHPSIARALHGAAVADQAILRAWIVNLGQRNARERMAHLICELSHRMEQCGLTLANGAFELALTQQELGSALGMTSIHTNRVLQRLRDERLLDYQNGTVQIHDLGQLTAMSGFDPHYLPVYN